MLKALYAKNPVGKKERTLKIRYAKTSFMQSPVCDKMVCYTVLILHAKDPCSLSVKDTFRKCIILCVI